MFFATTAPEGIVAKLVAHLESEHGCRVVGTSSHLSNRPKLADDMRRAAGSYDTLLTELKAAAIDVVAEAGAESGIPTVLCDNVPVPTGDGDLDGLIDRLVSLAVERGGTRSASDA